MHGLGYVASQEKYFVLVLVQVAECNLLVFVKPLERDAERWAGMQHMDYIADGQCFFDSLGVLFRRDVPAKYVYLFRVSCARIYELAVSVRVRRVVGHYLRPGIKNADDLVDIV